MTEQEKVGTGLSDNVAGALCYVLGWVTGIVFLILEPNNKNIRFHAWQSIVIFGAYTVLAIILNFIPIIGWILGMLLGIAAFILWIVLIIRTYQNRDLKIPVAGELARKWAG